MWRAYSYSVVATNFQCALSYVCDELSKMIVQYVHEATYDINCCVIEEKYNENMKQNNKALRLTRLYKERSICEEC